VAKKPPGPEGQGNHPISAAHPADVTNMDSFLSLPEWLSIPPSQPGGRCPFRDPGGQADQTNRPRGGPQQGKWYVFQIQQVGA